MAVCTACNAEVADDQMEAHMSEMHADGGVEAPAESTDMAAEAPAAEAAPAEDGGDSATEAPAEGGDMA